MKMLVLGAGLQGSACAFDDGRVKEVGVRPSYLATPVKPYVAELRTRGVDVVEERDAS